MVAAALPLRTFSVSHHCLHRPHLPHSLHLLHPNYSAHAHKTAAAGLGEGYEQLMWHLLSLAGSSASHHCLHHPHIRQLFVSYKMPCLIPPSLHPILITLQRLGWADKQLMRHLLSLAGSSGLDSRSLLTFTKALSSRGEYDRDVSLWTDGGRGMRCYKTVPQVFWF